MNETAIVDPAEDLVLVGQIEIARACKLSRQRIAQLAQEDSRFPRPVARLGIGPVYDALDVADWMVETGRFPRSEE